MSHDAERFRREGSRSRAVVEWDPAQAARAPLVPLVDVELSAGIRRILAPNPSPLTGPGTNTYLIGTDDLVVVDPGPDDEDHVDAVAAAGGAHIRWILVTHTHPDHAPAASGLKEATGAELLGFGEGVGFVPDRLIGEGFVLDVGGARLRALHTPGHASDHLCFLIEDLGVLLSGDHVMAGSTVVIAPPDGDMAAYLESLERLLALKPPLGAILPGHGQVLTDPMSYLRDYLHHRYEREQQILRALAEEPAQTIPELVETLYVGLEPALRPAAELSVWAHLRKLRAEHRVLAHGDLELEATWVLSGS
jgi:glyoxylase-like metal-dependent hydrolase (beta-lactamase superfamily II)